MPSLSIEYRDLGSLAPADRNAKQHNLEGIKASLRRFGLAEPVGLVDGRTGKLYGGHGRTEALTEMFLGGDEPPGGVTWNDMNPQTPWFVPVLVGWSSADDFEAEAVGIALNQHTIGPGWDVGDLDSQLAELRAMSFDPLELGFDKWPASLDADFAPTDGAEQPSLDHRKSVKCPSCGHEFEPGY